MVSNISLQGVVLCPIEIWILESDVLLEIFHLCYFVILFNENEFLHIAFYSNYQC